MTAIEIDHPRELKNQKTSRLRFTFKKVVGICLVLGGISLTLLAGSPSLKYISYVFYALYAIFYGLASVFGWASGLRKPMHAIILGTIVLLFGLLFVTDGALQDVYEESETCRCNCATESNCE